MTAPNYQRVSIVIPTFDRGALLSQAIRSGLQSQQVKEVLVVDNGTQDEGRRATELAQRESDRVRYIRLPASVGAQRARNIGMAAASTEYVKFLDDDDGLFPGALEAELSVIEATQADATLGDIAYTNHDLNITRVYQQPRMTDLVAGFLGADVLPLVHAVLYRRSSLRHLQWAEDNHLRHDIAFMGDFCSGNPKIAQVPAVVGLYRQHDGMREAHRFRRHPPHAAERECIHVLRNTVQALLAVQAMSQERRSCAAAGLWRYAHMISHNDRTCFRETFRFIRGLDQRFMPKRHNVLLRWLDRLGGPAMTESLMMLPRRVKHRVQASKDIQAVLREGSEAHKPPQGDPDRDSRT